MDNTILWWNLPATVKKILKLSQELEDCCDNTKFNLLVKGIVWYNLPSKIKTAVKELATKTDCFDGLEEIENINFQWFDILNGIKILKIEIENITCK